MLTENLITITLISSGLAFLAAVISAIVSIYNSRFTRYLRQRSWDRKVDTYSQIIEALSDLVYYYETVYDAECEGRDLSEKRREEVAEHWKNGYAKIKKASVTGSFLISTEAEVALQKMWKEKGKGVHPQDWFARYESDYVVSQDCLKEIVDAAKKDLQIR